MWSSVADLDSPDRKERQAEAGARFRAFRAPKWRFVSPRLAASSKMFFINNLIDRLPQGHISPRLRNTGSFILPLHIFPTTLLLTLMILWNITNS